MKPEIIKKLNLLPSNKIWGKSFEYDITIYTDKHANYFAMCNVFGEPSEYVNIINRANKGVALLEEFILDCPVEIIYSEFINRT